MLEAFLADPISSAARTAAYTVTAILKACYLTGLDRAWIDDCAANLAEVQPPDLRVHPYEQTLGLLLLLRPKARSSALRKRLAGFEDDHGVVGMIARAYILQVDLARKGSLEEGAVTAFLDHLPPAVARAWEQTQDQSRFRALCAGDEDGGPLAILPFHYI